MQMTLHQACVFQSIFPQQSSMLGQGPFYKHLACPAHSHPCSQHLSGPVALAPAAI